MKVCILTLGCKVNAYESEVIKSSFIKHQYEIVELIGMPDIIVINTCTVTNQSDAKSRKLIRSARKNNPEAIIVVCGCSSEQHKEALLPLGIDILIGNQDKTKIIEYIQAYQKNRKPICQFYNLNQTKFEDMQIQNFTGRTRAFVKIQDGCNNYCSYCIIPFVRGSVRNKTLNIAYTEIESLVNRGFKEIVLTGIHTSSYGLGTDYNLITLIKMISEIKNLKRIRISSIEITEINDEFLLELKNNPKICDHLHIPLQSGSDQILKAMGRKYNIDEYKSIIKKIRQIRPNINITTDVIVGFPSEKDEDHQTTLNNIKELKFGKIHVFPFSKRNGTKAAMLQNIVNDIVKKQRTIDLLKLSDRLENEYYKLFKNQKVPVLIEEINNNLSIGYTTNYIKVIINKVLTHNEVYEALIIDVVGKSVKGI